MSQSGQIFRQRRSWFGRWWRDELHRGGCRCKFCLRAIASGSSADEGRVVRRQHCERLADYGDRYRCKKDVRPLLNDKLRAANEDRCAPEGTLSVAEYTEKFYLPFAQRELKASTYHHYKGMFKIYLKPWLSDITMRDFRCVNATNILAAIHREHNLSRKSLGHCKGVLRNIFTHAKRAGVRDGENPCHDAGIPRAAKSGPPTHAYSPQEITIMLNALTGTAKLAIGVMYFCGLRPGEARGLRWEDYDPKTRTLRIARSVWRTVVNTPKTAASVATVPVSGVLADLLDATPRMGPHILASALNRPIDLHNLAKRVIRPALAACATCGKPPKKCRATAHEYKPLGQWHGFYALRRGCATLATQLETALAAKSLLRHSSIQTTAAHYIKSIPAEATRAAAKMDALFQNNGTVAPN